MISTPRGLAVLAAVFELGFAAPPATAQSVLLLDPTSGGVGVEVTGRQAVAPRECVTFALRWDTATGPVLGTDPGADGLGEATFSVPPSSSGDHLVVATCSLLPIAGAKVVGQARFFVTDVAASTTSKTVAGTALSPATSVIDNATTSTTRRPNPTTVTTGGAGAGGVTTGTTRPSPPLPRDAEECRRQAEEAQAAALVYQPKQRMTVGDTYDVAAALGLDLSDVTSVSLPGTAPTTVTVVGVTRCTIRAELTGADFDIDPPAAQEQSFVDRRVLSWRWQVKPLRTGSLTLILRIQPQIRDQTGERLAGAALDVDAPITVASRPESPISKVGRWTGAFFSHPAVQYLLLPAGSAGFLTVGALAWVRKKRA